MHQKNYHSNEGDNMKRGTKDPLYKTVHWRKLRDIVSEVSSYEYINQASYNVNNIRCYHITGDELKGKNVRYNLPDNYSCWVSNNHYEMYEIPALSNAKNSLDGNYLFLTHDLDFNYWIFGKMNTYTSSNDSKVGVFYDVYGEYKISDNNKQLKVVKTVNGPDIRDGRSRSQGSYFDDLESRRKAYNSSSESLVARVCNNKHYSAGGDDEYHQNKKYSGDTAYYFIKF